MANGLSSIGSGIGHMLGLSGESPINASQFTNNPVQSEFNKYALNANPAADAATGSQFATDQVQNNPVLGGLYGQGGQLSQAEGRLSDLQNQGFELKPEDQTLYGQQAGNIARQFGQQGNQMANDLASRGLSNSGAAGAAFSGLAGNQNEMLSRAQQQIAQQRFQNTMGQIGQYQNFVNSMGGQAGNAINQQYGRQLAGAQNTEHGLAQASELQNQANQGALNATEAQEKNREGTLGQAIGGGVAGGLSSAANDMSGGAMDKAIKGAGGIAGKAFGK